MSEPRMILNGMDAEASAKKVADKEIEELGLGGFLKGVAKGIGYDVKAVKKVASVVGEGIKKITDTVGTDEGTSGSAVKKTKTDAAFEKLHPRDPDGRFADKPAGTAKGLIPKIEDVATDVQNNANYEQFKKDFLDWNKKNDDYIKSETDKKRKQANSTYDDADNHLKLAAKYEAQLKNAKNVGAVGKYKSIQANIDKNYKKAEELRKKGDAIWAKPVKTYSVPKPVAPAGVTESPYRQPGTGQGLLPTPPKITIPPKVLPGKPAKVPRATPN